MGPTAPCFHPRAAMGKLLFCHAVRQGDSMPGHCDQYHFPYVVGSIILSQLHKKIDRNTYFSVYIINEAIGDFVA